MILKLNSVLRSIPTALDRRQALFIEGIRFCIEMADLAHTRLGQTLIRMASVDNEESKSSDSVSAMLDAWSVIDSLHRLRGLMRNMPGIQKRDRIPPIRAFFDSTANVVPLRNTVQHLDTDIGKTVDDRNWAVLGSLSWGVIYPEKNEVVACSFMPGMPIGSRPLINPINRQVWHLPVDSITIERSGIAVCLSDAMRRVEALAAALEKMLARTYDEQIPGPRNRYGADLTIALRFAIQQEQIVPEGTLDPEPDMPPEAPPESQSAPSS